MSTVNTQNLEKLYVGQSRYFAEGKTKPYAFRQAQLQKLKKAIKAHEADIIAALKADFAKPEFESYASEIGFVYEELNASLKHLRRWMRPKKVPSGVLNFPSTSYVRTEPKGVTLIIGPWNYPFQLLFSPLIASISAGNTCILKPSEQTPEVARVAEKIVSENFDANYLAVVQGEGHAVIPLLMENFRFDHVFFTGSVPVGRKIAEMAAPKLVPCTLELGGKSPAIVDGSADLKLSACRLAFGKWINAGQTCVAPDYVLVHESVKETFVRELEKAVKDFYRGNALESEHFASIISKKRFEVLSGYLGEGRIVFGGKTDARNLRISPTLIDQVSFEDALMQEEIFGPILPLLTYKTREEAFEGIAKNPFPLALYIFARDKKVQKAFTENIRFGGGMVNNTLVHLTNSNLPFGGIGTSGYGHYHGKFGFDAFSHQKGIMKTATWFDLKMKYPPYGKGVNKLIRWFMR